ncbi:MAG: hypothetical protein N2484_18335 [Clostridia bacterium]|nr:hypothetical protein [Clostridia bacterium]
MNNEMQFEKLIKNALTEGESGFELGNGPLVGAKSRLKAKSEGYRMNSNYKLFKHSVVGRTIATASCAIIALALVVAFVQPVRAMAQQAVSMIYTVVKGEDGKYKAVQIPDDRAEMHTTTTLMSKNPENKDMTKEVGFADKIPSSLKGGFVLDGKGVITWDDSSKKGINAIFKKDKSLIFLQEIDYPSPEYMNLKDKGDNRQEIKLGNKTLVYCEQPMPIYENIAKGEGAFENDVTRPPKEIKTMHAIVWEQGGLYYILSDLGDLNLDTLEVAAKSMIESSK